MRTLVCFLGLLLLCLLSKAQTNTYSAQPGESAGQDANLSKLNGSTNYSTSPTLKISRNTSSLYERALIRFDLTGLTPGVEVASAKLYLYGVNHQVGTGDGSGILQMVPNAWYEDKATWNNSVLLQASGMPTLALSTPGSSSQNYTLDVTSMVQSMINTPLVNFGWLITMATENNSNNRGFEFGSSDNSSSALRPKLEVTYAQPLSVNAYVAPAEHDTAHNGGAWLQVSGGVPPYSFHWSNGQSGSSTYNVLPGVYQFTVTDDRNSKVVRPLIIPNGCGSTTYTLDYSSPGAFSDVVLLKESFNDNTQNKNFRSTAGITAYNKTNSSGNSKARSLLDFDLNFIPQNAVINSATLRLTDNEASYSSTFSVQLCRVTGSWKESTVTHSSQPTYNDSLGDVIEFAYDASASNYDFDVTSQLQKMVTSGNTTMGWLLKLKTENETTVGKSVTFFGAESGSGTMPKLIVQFTLPDHVCSDAALNWHQEDMFDESGAIMGSQKTYYDNMGRTTQHLTRNATSEVFTSQTLYDQYGRATLATKSAFTGNQLVYHPGFMRSQNGQIYQYTHFDTPATLNNPAPLQNGVSNTLGYYYSDNNAYDAFQATAENPYSRIEYAASPLGGQKRISQPGTPFKMGSGRESYSFNMVSGNELQYVYGTNLSYKAKESASDPLDCTALTENGVLYATKIIAITPDNREQISYMASGQLLGSCLSGLTSDGCSFGVENKMFYKGTQSTDLHLPDGYKNSLTLALPTQQGDAFPMSASNISFKIVDLYRDQALVENVDYVVDPGSRLVSFQSSFLNLYTNRGLVLRVNFSYNASYESSLIAGGIVPADVTISYVIDYGRFSKNYYDLRGSLLKSVSPKGFGCSNPNTISMSSTYNYDHRGLPIASKTPDEGLTEMLYDTEGKLRFVQNAEQRAGNRFSYRCYDKHGRTYETGEYQSALAVGSVWFNTPSPYSGTVAAEAIVDNTDGLPTGAKSFVTTTGYEEPTGANDVPNTYSYFSQYRNFRNGSQCFVKNEQSTIWYNYDKFDRPLASITQITESDFVSKNPGINNQIKTKDFSYNYFTGLTASSTFQNNNSSEKIAYQYNYDGNYRLSTCSLSYGGITQKLAQYTYNKGGQIKRVVTANNLQGTDLVYTLNGGLKAINHPGLDPSVDPGGDNGDYVATTSNVNKDLFGEVIDYYAGDYVRTNSYISSSIGNMNSKYNGLVYAVRFKTRGTVGADQSRANFVDYGGSNQDSILTGLVYKDKEFRFAYTYDELNQLATSVFGTYDNNLQTFSIYNGYSEKGASSGNIGYDRNGNITRLVRQAYRNTSNNSPIPLDDLNYTNASNSNRLTSIVDAASNSFAQSVNFKTPSLSSPSSFVYNNNGQLTQSLAEDVSDISYYPDGKVKKITFNSTGNTTEYIYGVDGQRLKSKYHIAASNKNKYTWYVGPLIYEYTETDPTPAFRLSEARIKGGVIRLNSGTNISSGYVVYHVTDHLGNIRATYKASGSGNGIQLLSRDDYYAFGGAMPGRSWKVEDSRYGYQGQEKAGESNPWDQFELRMYNHDLGRWFTPDPYGQFASAYIGMGNNPVSLTDPDGGQVSLPTGAAGGRFVNGELMAWQRDIRTGGFSAEATQARYDEEYKNLRKHFEESGRQDPEAFLEAVQELNNYYYSLTKASGVQPAYNAGFDALTQNELTDCSTTAFRNGSGIKGMEGGMEMLSHIEPDIYWQEKKNKEFKESKAKGQYWQVVNKIMQNGFDTGKREVVTYFSDGSEIHQTYLESTDEKGNITVTLTDFAYRSPKFVEEYNSRVGSNSSFNSNSVLINDAMSFAIQQTKNATGELTLSSLLSHYVSGSGENYVISQSSFNGFVSEMGNKNKLIYTQKMKVDGHKDCYAVTVSAYGTSYENSVGSATLYFDHDGIAGFYDYWDFDKKKKGERSAWAEFKTTVGAQIPGKPFVVTFGFNP